MKKIFSIKGFTLIEILIALAIISILFVILIPQVNGYFGKSKEAGVRSAFRDFQISSHTYLSDSFGKDLHEDFLNMYLDAIYEISDNNGLLETKAKDPWGKSYGVEFGNRRITIFSFGKEGNNKHYSLSSYYYKGIVDFCTVGFPTNNVSFSSIKDVPSDFTCGEDFAFSSPSNPILDSPNNFNATNVTNTSATLSWGSVDGADSYILKRNGITIYIGSGLSYSDITLTPGQTYTYSLAARNATSISNYITLQVITDSTPLTPTGFVANGITDSSVQLSWNPSLGATGYLLKRDGVTVYSGSSNLFIDNGLKDYTSYHYTLVAYNASSSSPPAVLTVKTKANYETIKLPDIGTGSCGPYDPYVIMTLGELQGIDLDLQACYELGANIDGSYTSAWNEGKGFKPIGDLVNDIYFSGALDGKNYSINKLSMNRPDSDAWVAIFDEIVNDGILKNIKINEVKVVGKNYVAALVSGISKNATIDNIIVTGEIVGKNYVGGIVAYNNGEINNVHTETGAIISGFNDIGGIIGFNNGVIKNADSNVQINGTNRVGGISGSNIGQIMNARVLQESKIIGSNEDIGGIVGYNDTIASIENATVESINVTGYVCVGGIAGWNGGTFKNVNSNANTKGNIEVGGVSGGNFGTITFANAGSDAIVTGGYDIGGIIGNNSGTLQTTSSEATVIGSDFNTGGVIGSNEASGHLMDATSSANVTGGTETGGVIGYNNGSARDITSSAVVNSDDRGVGGISGLNTGTLTNAFATDLTNVTGVYIVGGIVGFNSGILDNAISESNVSAEVDAGGIVGNNFGTIKNIITKANVSTTDRGAGGIAGYNDSVGRILNARADSKTKVVGDSYVGGIIGLNYGFADTVHSEAYISGNWAVGIISGWNSGTITNATSNP